MFVKICGLRTAEHALAATTAGADLLGFVFAPSRRRITPDEAAAIAVAVRAHGQGSPLLVGLFVNADPEEIDAVAARVGLDAVQLSGDEPPEHAARLALPMIKTVRLDGSSDEAGWITRWETQHATTAGLPSIVARPSSVFLLVDAHVPGSYGGTGIVADWGQAAALARRGPIFLAGGLTPENVSAAIASVRPLGVDVSSGVESGGVKDPRKIEAFIGAARAAQ